MGLETAFLFSHPYFEFPILPLPKPRPRFARGHAYTPHKYKQFEAHVRGLFLRQAAHLDLAFPLKGPLALTACFVLPRPKTQKTRAHPYVKPDLDNFLKALLDAINGAAWDDDGQIVTITATKTYVDDAVKIPSILFSVEPLGE